MAEVQVVAPACASVQVFKNAIWPKDGDGCEMRSRFEVLLIKVAIYILKGRNVARCRVVSRRDNNQMWGMCDHLEAIERRIRTGYAKQ